MGDVSAEPSMEEILSSIKRIIAEEGDATATRQRRPRSAGNAAPPPPPQPVQEYDDDPDAVLELNDPVVAPAPAPIQPARAPEATRRPELPEPAPDAAILSRQTADATRGSLEALSRLIVKPEGDSDGTLEGLVREMLRPMLREWLDANLPPLVEKMVAREIAKITAQPH